MARKTYDEMALEILLSDRTPGRRLSALRALAARADRDVEGRLEGCEGHGDDVEDGRCCACGGEVGR